MKSFYFLLAVIATVSGWGLSDLAREEWQSFKLEHKKEYKDASEELLRLRIYLNNRRMVAKHNRRYHRDLESYSLKTNQFSDKTHQEYLKIAKGFKPPSRRKSKNPATKFMSLANVIFKKTVDWRQLGAVSEVKNQLDCQSCWAISAAGALEGQLFLKTKSLASLSAQNLVDCSLNNNGCEGGNIPNAFNDIASARGIDTEEYYPYEGIDDSCRYNPRYSGGYNIGYYEIYADEEELMKAVAVKGPISVAVDSSLDEFKHYEKGVFYNKNCTQEVNHGMLVVGYGTDEKEGDYWLLKNSYGSTWGEEGYMRLARNRDNHCGIASFSSYPVLPA